MWVCNGNCEKTYADDEPFRADDGTSYPGNWDKATVPGMRRVVLTPEPQDEGFVTTGNVIQMVDGVPTRVWSREAVVPHVPSVGEMNAEIMSRIAMLDAKRIRPAAEVTMALAQQIAPAQADVARLNALTAEIAALRSQLQ